MFFIRALGKATTVVHDQTRVGTSVLKNERISMRIHTAVFSLIVAIGTILATTGCTSREVTETRQMTIAPIDVGFVRDGVYQNDYTYGKFRYIVSVTVKGHKITEIQVLNNRSTKHAKMAEGVILRVVSQQRTDVDAVSGATTTSKALLKAIEKALSMGLPSK
jgi:uncharacterized protein with FMN-binding domain